MFRLNPLPRNLDAALADGRHPRPAVREAAARDLGRHAAGAARARVVAALERLLDGDPMETVQATAAESLADAVAVESLPALTRAARGGSAKLRQMSLLALGEILPQAPGAAAVAEALGAVRAALEDELPGLRFQALLALENAAPDAEHAALLHALHDDDAEVRYLAVRLLDERIRRGASGQRSLVEHAEVALADSNASVRLAAALVVVSHGGQAASEEIVRALNARARIRHIEDEQAALEAVARYRLRDAIPGLRRRVHPLLGSASSAWLAWTAWAALGGERAQARILRQLRSRRRDRRTMAVLAVGKAGLQSARALLEANRDRREFAEVEATAEALRRLDGRNEPSVSERLSRAPA